MTEKRREKRTIGVSDRAYGVFSYGARVYHVSVIDFIDKFIDAYAGREKIVFPENSQESTVSGDLEPKSTVSEGLIEEGLKLIEAVSPEKAAELRVKLESLKSTVSEETEAKSTVSANPSNEG